MKILKLLIASVLTSALLISCGGEQPATTVDSTVTPEVSAPAEAPTQAETETDTEIETETSEDNDDGEGFGIDGATIRSACSLAQANYLLSGHTGEVEYFIKSIPVDGDLTTTIEVCPDNATEESFGQIPWTSHEWTPNTQMAQDAIDNGEFRIIVGDGGEIIEENLSEKLFEFVPEPVEGVDYIDIFKYINNDMTDEEILAGYQDFINVNLEMEFIDQETADMIIAECDIEIIRGQLQEIS